VVGSLERSAARRVAELAESIGAVVFADARCGLRTGNPFSPNVVAYQDLVLQSSEISLLMQPDVILMFGERMTSHHVYDYVERANVNTIRVTDSPSIVDPSRSLSAEIICDVAGLCDDIVEVADGNLGTRDLEYLEYWTRLSGHAESILDTAPQINSELTEPAIARAITKLLPSESCFHVSSSMPIRDVDTFGLRRSKAASITSNRGASGIDGTIATARGVQIAGGRTTTVFIGDLAFLHDLNSLALASDDSLPFIIVVVNNDGGGIFSMLPISEHQKYFEEGFGTPHGYSFECAARLFRYEYKNPETLSEFESAYLRATTSDGPTIIEVATRRDENVQIHEKLQELVRTEIAKISNH
jgi:2-succinyl-5-enolpyruvyl-6-hydroxy-3-cyclohexene-1-carboxylate synthase